MLINLMYVTLNVTDQDRALEFYTEGLGLEKRIDHPGPQGRFLTVGVPGSPVQLLLWPHPAAAGVPGTPSPVFLESDDLRKDVEVMRGRGVAFEGEPADYPFGVRVEAIDPDGNRIALRERRTR
ncbi:VOC family protein [Actinoplanes flavus]|uniref:VOC family protein n=1 Tax=Actinoplanes flavus TaxID=2820290 RepID=A0ABS3UVX4_9ACTN|nr:VOC family protein [Actinoplanes flavus]MBO3742729.1 VOC family protein [Actinoplanes flavus]